MKKFTNVVKEVRSSINNLVLFEIFINTLLIFLVLLLVLSFFNFSAYYGIAASVLYLLIALPRRLRTNKIRMVEERYGNLNEKLRTAAEYATAQNAVVEELQQEVVADLKKVEQASFINEKRVYLKSVMIVVFCFVILLLSPISFGILDFNFDLGDVTPTEPQEELAEGNSGSSNLRVSVGPHESGLRKASEDIYGEPTVAKLGNNEVKIRIRPAGSELSIREIQEAQPPDFGQSHPEGEVSAVFAENYEESIAKEDIELVRSYFNQVAGN